MERQQQLIASGKTTHPHIWGSHQQRPHGVELLMISANENSTNQNWSHSESYPPGVFRNYQQACFAFISPRSWSGKLGVYSAGGSRLRGDQTSSSGERQNLQKESSLAACTQRHVKERWHTISCDIISFLTWMPNRSLTAWMLSEGSCEVPALHSLMLWVEIPSGTFLAVPWFKIFSLEHRGKALGNSYSRENLSISQSPAPESWTRLLLL